MPPRQERLPLLVLGIGHVDHPLGEEQKPQRGLMLGGVDEVGLPAGPLARREELPHAPVPVEDLVDPGELIAVHELVQGGLQHPQLPVVVDDELLAEPVVPQAQHHVD